MFFFRESQRATEEKEKTAKPPLFLLPFPRFFPLPAAAIEASLPALQAADDVGARSRGGREVVVDRGPHDRALRVVERVDRRDGGADGRDERALGLHVAADGRHRDEEGRDLRSLGLDVTADGLHQDEHGLEVDALRGDRAPDGRDAEADGRDVDALPSDGNARGGDGDEARREVDAGGGQSDAWGERGGEREVLARFEREEREKKRSENVVGEKKRAKKTNVER